MDKQDQTLGSTPSNVYLGEIAPIQPKRNSVHENQSMDSTGGFLGKTGITEPANQKQSLGLACWALRPLC